MGAEWLSNLHIVFSVLISHAWTTPASPPHAITSGKNLENLILSILWPCWSFSSTKGIIEFILWTLIIPEDDPLIIVFSSIPNSTQLTLLVWPLNVLVIFFCFKSNSGISPEDDPATKYLLLDENEWAFNLWPVLF